MVVGMGSFELGTALTTCRLDDIEFAVESMHLSCNVEDMSVRLVVAGELCDQPPVAGLTCQFHGLVEGGCLF